MKHPILEEYEAYSEVYQAAKRDLKWARTRLENVRKVCTHTFVDGACQHCAIPQAIAELHSK